MVAVRSIILVIFVLAAMSSAMVIRALGSLATSTRMFGYFSPIILVWVLLPMVFDYFNGCARARSLRIAPQIKIRENLHWYFQVHGLVSIFGCHQESSRLYHRRKSLKTSKICYFIFTFMLSHHLLSLCTIKRA
jgi:hypothetical protein